MKLGPALLRALLSIQAERNWNETEMAAELGVALSVWSNWKKRKAVSKDGFEPIYWRFPESFPKASSGQSPSLSSDAHRLVELIAEADQRHGSRPGYWTHLLGLAQQLTSGEPAAAASGRARPTPEFQALVAWGKNKKMSPADIKEMVALARKSTGAGDASTRAA